MEVEENLFVVYFEFENGETGHTITNDREEAEFAETHYLDSMSNKMGSSTIVDTKLVEYSKKE